MRMRRRKNTIREHLKTAADVYRVQQQTRQVADRDGALANQCPTCLNVQFMCHHILDALTITEEGEEGHVPAPAGRAEENSARDGLLACKS